MTASDETIRVWVDAIAIPPMSTIGYGLGHDEQGRIIEFVGEHRAMQRIGEALNERERDDEETVADVPLYCILDIRGPMTPTEVTH